MNEIDVFDLIKYDPSKSLFISASAGTGKTFTIKGIVRKLLSEKRAKLEEILIVTFTEKAVGELKDRIRKEVSEANLSGVDVDNAPIYTIHSFCQNTLKEFSFTANKPLNLDLIDEKEIGSFIDRWVRDELINDSEFRELYDESKSADLIGKLKDDFQAAIGKFYLNENGEIDENIVGLKKDQDTRAEYREYYRKARKINCLDDYDEQFPEYNFVESYNQLKDSQIDYAIKIVDSIDEYIEGGRFLEVCSGNTLRKKIDNVAEEIREAYQNIKNIKEFLAKVVGEVGKFYGQFLADNIEKLYKLWQEEKSKNKTQSYDDMIRNIREAICEKDSELLKQLRSKYKYAIIDEFQDTNQKQWDIFSKIFLNVEDHSIIVVGDEKQSIYAFQGADVNVFNNAREEIKAGGGEINYLPTNFRSTPDMVAACNLLFKAGNGFFTNTTFTPSRCSGVKLDNGDVTPKIQCPKFMDETIPAFIFSEQDIEPEKFAKFAVQQIVRFCKKTDGKTALQIWDEDLNDEKGGYRNVELNDFAVLARTKTEMKPCEDVFTEYGVPFSRYKNPNLYDGTECAHWISLFAAINAPDFTERNRRFLSEALFTRFFDVPLNKVLDKKYDNPSDKIRQNLNNWKNLASKKQWGNLIETIFEDTGIEKKLSNLSDLQSLSKFRQIGDYSCDYLYKKNCSLDELISHLTRLSNSSGDESSLDEGLVAKGTDFKCVQIMTIHASKGLQFPIVISAAGFKGKNNKIPQVYHYHENGRSYIGFSDAERGLQTNELLEEWQRLFYVDFTRAESLLILPRYKGNKDLGFYHNSINEFFKQASHEQNKRVVVDCNKRNADELESLEIEKLYDECKLENITNLRLEVSEIVTDSARNTITAAENSSEEAQKKILSEFALEAHRMNLGKHSYSSLTHSLPENEDEMSHNLSRFDDVETVPVKANSYDEHNLKEMVTSDYPKGARLGEVIHEIFEKSDYTKEVNPELIKQCFRNQGWTEQKTSWIEISKEFAENTLNALFPEIHGSKQCENEFCLNEITNQNKITEAEFTMNSKNKAVDEVLKDYLTGFIDLIFKRKIDGKEVYSVLDWKTDTIEKEDYADFEKLKEHVDKCYSIQRVLYSYCLIKWLKSFGCYSDMSESDIFENHFGGIYYVLIRGCKAGTSNGIYAHTWKSWENLQDAFNRICEELIEESGESK